MILVFDLDGTLADNRHREHLLAGESPQWDAFFEACDQDKLVVPIANIAQCMWVHGHRIVVLTGRPESVRNKTSMWLTDNGVPYHKLLMRPDGDYRPSTDLKRALLQENVIRHLLPDEAVVAIDNDEKDCAMYRELGCVSLLVGPLA